MQARRCFMSKLFAASLLASCALSAQAQSFPAKPLRIVVPFGAGGVADLTARTVAQKMSEGLGQSVVIDNRPGAGGIVAAEMVAKAEPDGYTLLLMSNANAVSAGLFKTLPFDPVKDFTPVSLMGTFDLAIVTSADSRFHTLPELLAWAKANPGKLNIGSINIGSTQHLAAELFKSTAGIDAQVVAVPLVFHDHIDLAQGQHRRVFSLAALIAPTHQAMRDLGEIHAIRFPLRAQKACSRGNQFQEHVLCAQTFVHDLSHISRGRQGI